MEKNLDAFFNSKGKWQDAYAYLRKLLQHKELTEAFKWGKPCYTYNGNNVVLIHGFKDYCALLFHKGVLLKDPKGILVQQTKNVQSARQLRFENLQQIKKQEKAIKDYVKEAIDIEKKGLKVPMKKTAAYEMPEELDAAMEENPELKKAFKNLTPGRQRGYLLYFSDAKQSSTRINRILKYTPHIIAGKGLNDD